MGVNHTYSFSAFSNSLLFNYWNAHRDPMLNDFLNDTIPYILSENTGYTAYAGTAYSEEDIVKEVKSISFKNHPYFKSNYKTVSFSLLLKSLITIVLGIMVLRFHFHTNQL